MVSIDVLLPVRYPSPWLGETLAGLAAQDCRDWRLVMVIHGEDMGLSSLVRDSAIPATVHSVPTTFSLADVLNFGLTVCTAPFIARLDADDVPLPGRLREQSTCLRVHPECAIVVSSAVLIDNRGLVQGMRPVPLQPDKVIRKLAWKNCIVHPAVMFRRQSVLDVGGYASQARHAEDYELWLRLLARNNVCVSPTPAINYRLHDGQVTTTKTISREARAQILEARLGFARARGIPAFLARFQHAVWAFRQSIRSLNPMRRSTDRNSQ